MESQVAAEVAPELEAAPVDEAQNVFDQPSAELDEETGSLEVIAGSEVVAGEVSDEARACLDRIKEHVKIIDQFHEEHYWTMAEDAYYVIDNQLHKKIGYKKLQDYLEAEVGIMKTRFYYYSRVYKYFNKTLKGILAEKPDLYNMFLAEIKKMGWTKAAVISTQKTIVKNNAEEIIGQILAKEANGKTQSVTKLEELCKTEKVRLEAEDPASLEEADGGEESVETSVRLNFSFTRVQYNDVVKAMDHVKKISGDGTAKATVLASICRDYSATHTIGDDDKVLPAILSNYERLSGMTIVAYDPKTSEIVYGNLPEVEDEVKEGGV